jgi:2-dehydro-3-deoxy-D-gluconate 5-dehydrogenase
MHSVGDIVRNPFHHLDETRRTKLLDLSGKVAVVTGGNGGIGLGMARGLASAGATVVIAARNLKKSQAAVADLASHGASASAILVDVTQEASVSALFSATLERCGRLDILVNNAGTNIRHPAQELSLAEWHTVIDTNLTSAFMCAKAAYPIFKRGDVGPLKV